MKTKTTLAVTLPVILAPMLYGAAVYNRLPMRLATHWGISSDPNGYGSRALVVFGLPLLMALGQIFALTVSRKRQRAPRFERVVAWIIPAVTVVAYLTTIAYNLGQHVDIWRIAIVLVAAIFIAMGNYLPTVPAGYQHSLTWPHQRLLSKRATRNTGYAMVAAGIALLLSLFTLPLVSAIIVGIAVVAIAGINILN
ncbi:DUF1648 domain-containing protein [Lacticaseibacillus sp. GG6-2]